VRRAGNAWIIGPHKHLESGSDLVFTFVHDLGNELLHVMLDVAEVLVRRDDTIGIQDDSPLIYLVVVEKNASRYFYSADSVAGP